MNKTHLEYTEEMLKRSQLTGKCLLSQLSN